MSQGTFGFANTPEWQQAALEDVLVAEVVFNLPLERPYSYAIPQALRDLIRPGQRVTAPLGRSNRMVTGYCVAVHPAEPGLRNLKSIDELLDSEPLLDQQMLQLTRWIGERYLCGWGQVLDSVIPAGVRRKSGTREIQCFVLSEQAEALLAGGRLSAGQKAVVEAIRRATVPLSAPDLCAAAGCGPGPVSSLRKKGVLVPVRI